MIITVLAFLLTLGVLIVIHEYGHYRVAVACNVKVLRFSVGFGRVIWSRRHGPDQCEFVLSALPLGGYVRMLDEREGAVDPAERHRAFNQRPLMQRVAIVSAGPLANLALAVLLYASAHWIGVEEPKAVLSAPAPASVAERAGLRSGDWVRSISADGNEWRDVRSMSDLRWSATQAALQAEPVHLTVSGRDGRGSRVVRLDLSGIDSKEVDAALMKSIGLGAPFSEPVMGEVKTAGPAAVAGLQAGDRILRVDDTEVTDAQTLRERIQRAIKGDGGVPMAWTVDRDGRTLVLTVTPRVIEGSNGAPASGRIDAYVGRPAEMVLVRHGPVDGIVQGAVRTWEVSALTLKMLGRMLVGEASLKNLSGPLTIADYAGQSVQQGLSYYLAFLALVSVSLGVLNLLPLPMLDGGHLMYYLFEGVTGRPIPERWLDRLQRGGVAVLLVMMSVALFNDVARLLGLH
ncbi:MAG TPA: RIP metalloprotease RseP [Rubrivivax sp.]